MNGNDGQTTGDTRVDAALARFDELAEAPLTTHPKIFEDVHRRLQDALTGIEQDPAPAAATEEPAPSDAEARTPRGAGPGLASDAEGGDRAWPDR